MVKWWNKQEAMVKQVYDVPVKDLGLFDEVEGKEILVETVPVCDLTNDEYVKLQGDPFLDGYPGRVSDSGSQKNQAFMIVATHFRIQKAHMKLGLNFDITPAAMMKWGLTRSGDLAMRIKEHLDSVTKKSKSSQNQTNGKPSGTPANTPT